MMTSTDDEIKKSLTVTEELRCEGKNLSFVDAGAGRIVIDLRVKEPHQLTYLARLVAHLGYEEIHFAHAQLWITTWGVWDPQVEAIGRKTLAQFRRNYSENRPLESAPGHYFSQVEFEESVCCLLQPMMVGWDAYYVPRWRFGNLDYFVSISHDSFIDVEIRTQEMYERAMGILRRHEWIIALLRTNG